MRFKVGDLVRNPAISEEGIGIVLEIVADHDGVAGYPQLKVGTAMGITLWWPSVTEVIG
jgi:hypothetical protein